AIPANSSWEVAARPDSGGDLTLVSWFQAFDDGCYPERMVPAPSCQSANRAGASQPETLRLDTAGNGFEAVILVGAAPNSPAGGYKLIVRNP
ncbi:MAG: hypothetical protein AAGA48_14935, partial [Myxococcota bacterium]